MSSRQDFRCLIFTFFPGFISPWCSRLYTGWLARCHGKSAFIFSNEGHISVPHRESQNRSLGQPGHQHLVPHRTLHDAHHISEWPSHDPNAIPDVVNREGLSGRQTLQEPIGQTGHHAIRKRRGRSGIAQNALNAWKA